MSNSEQTTKAKQTAEKSKLTPEQREAQRKQALDDAAKKAVSSVTNLRAYLAVQSRFERYSTNNNLLIFAQRPDATRLKSLELWNKEKKWIREGAKAVAIYEPVRKQGKDGKTYTNFVRKNMFDISDIKDPEPDVQQTCTVAEAVQGLFAHKAVDVRMIPDYPSDRQFGAFYDAEENCVYDDATINCLVQVNEILEFDVGEEVPTDSVDLAFYNRNRLVEDEHEVQLVFTTGSTQADYAGKLNIASMGGESYDIVETWHWYVDRWTYFVDLQQYTDVLHFENPYWATGVNDNTLIKGKQYITFGFGSSSIYSSAMAVYYNEHLRLNYGLDEFEPLVESGDWTIENMLTMMEKATSITDTTANSFENKYGLGYNLWSGRAFLWGCGLQLSSYTDGELEITLANETNFDIHTKVKQFLTGNNYSYYGGGGGNDNGGGSGEGVLFNSNKNDIHAFMEYKTLFESTNLGRAQTISQSMPNFGILPMPKLNKDQQDYITPVGGVSPFGIMKSSPDARRAAVILETFTIYSYTTVRPEYYENALKLRYQTDAKAAKMVDFIVDHLSIDFLFINSSSFESVADKPFDLIEPFGKLQGEGYYSYMGKLQNQMEGYLEKFYKVYEDAEKDTGDAT